MRYATCPISIHNLAVFDFEKMEKGIDDRPAKRLKTTFEQSKIFLYLISEYQYII